MHPSTNFVQTHTGRCVKCAWYPCYGGPWVCDQKNATCALSWMTVGTKRKIPDRPSWRLQSTLGTVGTHEPFSQVIDNNKRLNCKVPCVWKKMRERVHFKLHLPCITNYNKWSCYINIMRVFTFNHDENPVLCEKAIKLIRSATFHKIYVESILWWCLLNEALKFLNRPPCLFPNWPKCPFFPAFCLRYNPGATSAFQDHTEAYFKHRKQCLQQ